MPPPMTPDTCRMVSSPSICFKCGGNHFVREYPQQVSGLQAGKKQQFHVIKDIKIPSKFLDSSTNIPLCDVKILYMSVVCFLHTGSEVTLIHKDVLIRLGIFQFLNENDKRLLQSASGHIMETLSSIHLPFEMFGLQHSFKAFVCDSLPGPYQIVLGWQDFSAINKQRFKMSEHYKPHTYHMIVLMSTFA